MAAFASLSARDRRALRLGALVAVPALLWAGLVRPYAAALGDARGELAAEREALARERALVADRARLAARRLAADSAVREAAGRLFSARDDLLASADLAAYLARTARASRVALESADTRPATTSAAGVHTLTVEIRGESDAEGIATFLQALERGTRLVTVERLAITEARVDAGADAEDGADAGVERLTLSAAVHGYSLADAPAVAPAPPAQPAAADRAARPVASHAVSRAPARVSARATSCGLRAARAGGTRAGPTSPLPC